SFWIAILKTITAKHHPNESDRTLCPSYNLRQWLDHSAQHMADSNTLCVMADCEAVYHQGILPCQVPSVSCSTCNFFRNNSSQLCAALWYLQECQRAYCSGNTQSGHGHHCRADVHN